MQITCAAITDTEYTGFYAWYLVELPQPYNVDLCDAAVIRGRGGIFISAKRVYSAAC
jgi:hypothetical protein